MNKCSCGNTARSGSTQCTPCEVTSNVKDYKASSFEWCTDVQDLKEWCAKNLLEKDYD